MDKGDVVRAAATSAVKSIIKACPPESTRVVFRSLESILEQGKWRTKVGVLDSFKLFVPAAPDHVASELGAVLPKVEASMHDTKQEVSLPAEFPLYVTHSQARYPRQLSNVQLRYVQP